MHPSRSPAPAALAALAVILFSSGALLANETWVVDTQGAGGGDFTSLQAAITAASDGDVVLVRNGNHGDVVIDGKSLTLIHHPFGTSPKLSSLRIRNLAAHQRVVVRDLRVGADNVNLFRCAVDQCAGPVFLEEVEAFVEVTNAANVVLTRCVLYGEDAPFPQASPPPTGPALRVENASVSIYESIVSGGHGVSAGIPPFQTVPTPSQAGAPGIELVSGSCFVAGCQVRGGNGGNGFFTGSGCLPGQDGTPAILANGALTVMDSNVIAGGAGFDPAPCPQVGVTPPPVALGPSGSHASVGEPLRTLFVSSPAFAQPQDGTNEIGTVFEGQPGEAVLLFLSAQPSGVFLTGLSGALAPAPPWIAAFIGPVPPDGTIDWKVKLPPALPAGVGGVVLFEQAAVPGAAGTGVLSSPSTVVIADP